MAGDKKKKQISGQHIIMRGQTNAAELTSNGRFPLSVNK
jgi:hypothetical protein